VNTYEKKGSLGSKNSTSLSGFVTLAIGMLATCPASAALPNCTASALNALGVNHVSVSAAIDTPAVGSKPEFCDVFGAVVTAGNGAPQGSANFEMQLPANWNGKFYFKGVGGFAGAAFIAFGADNPVDASEALPKGYAIAISDTGHTGQGLNAADFAGIVTDARWALKADGTPDEAKITDYYFRATHDVTVAAKSLTEKFFDQGKIHEAYFDGCSNGGRMALMEASRFPDDYDGIVAGDPFMSIRSIAAGAQFDKQLLTPDTFIPYTLLPAIDQATLAACDATDGVADGIIQNPAACSFKPQSLLCQAGQSSNCLSQGQVDTLTAYFSAATDANHKIVYPGFAISDLSGADGAAEWTLGGLLPGAGLDLSAAEPWGNIGFAPAPLGWQFVDHAVQYFVERDANFNTRDFDGSAYTPISAATLNLFDKRTDAGDADVPAKFDRFIAKNRKLLIYHGFSDPALTPMRSIMFYEGLADRVNGRYDKLQENVRLFMVPDMHHCGGGPGPSSFDTLTALENWVEKGSAPDAIVATKFVNDNPAQGVARTMPLCKFPEQASFQGGSQATPAEINDAANWSCSSFDRSLLQVGDNGVAAGIGGRQAPEHILAVSPK